MDRLPSFNNNFYSDAFAGNQPSLVTEWPSEVEIVTDQDEDERDLDTLCNDLFGDAINGCDSNTQEAKPLEQERIRPLKDSIEELYEMMFGESELPQTNFEGNTSGGNCNSGSQAATPLKDSIEQLYETLFGEATFSMDSSLKKANSSCAYPEAKDWTISSSLLRSEEVASLSSQQQAQEVISDALLDCSLSADTHSADSSQIIHSAESLKPNSVAEAHIAALLEEENQEMPALLEVHSINSSCAENKVKKSINYKSNKVKKTQMLLLLLNIIPPSKEWYERVQKSFFPDISKQSLYKHFIRNIVSFNTVLQTINDPNLSTAEVLDRISLEKIKPIINKANRSTSWPREGLTLEEAEYLIQAARRFNTQPVYANRFKFHGQSLNPAKDKLGMQKVKMKKVRM